MSKPPVIKNVELIIPSTSEMPGGYSNTMFINHNQTEFNMYFFEVVPPLIIGTDEQRKEAIDKLQQIQPRPVARVVVSPKRLKSIIKALQTNLDQYESRFGIIPDDEEETED